MANIVVKRIPELTAGANAQPGWLIAVYDPNSNTTKRVNVNEFINNETSSDYDWKIATSYSVNEVVFHNNKLWASSINGNIGNVPQAGPNWVEVVQGQSGGLKTWEASAYTADEVFVVYDDGAGNQLYELVAVVRPYNSIDIDAEILAGGWEQFGANMTDQQVEDAYNNQVAAASQGEAEAGIEADIRRFSPLRIAQAISALTGTAQSKLDAIIPPTVNNDTSEGYSVSSLWLDTVLNEYYRCSDPTTGAAVWPKTTLTADELATVAVSGQYSDLLGLPIIPSPAGSSQYEIQLRNTAGDGFEVSSNLAYTLDRLLKIGGTTSGEVNVYAGDNQKQVVFGASEIFGALVQLFNLDASKFFQLAQVDGAGFENFINSAKPFGFNTITPNANAQVDIVSTIKGFSKPRMSTAQRSALGVLLANVDADKGMEVYDLNTLSGFKWNGTQWVEDGAGGTPTVEERIMFDSNLDVVRVIYYSGVLTFGAFNIDGVKIDTLEFETSTDGITWTSHGSIVASGTPPAALNAWVALNGSGNWYLRLSAVYKAGQTLPTGTQFSFER